MPMTTHHLLAKILFVLNTADGELTVVGFIILIKANIHWQGDVNFFLSTFFIRLPKSVRTKRAIKMNENNWCNSINFQEHM